MSSLITPRRTFRRFVGSGAWRTPLFAVSLRGFRVCWFGRETLSSFRQTATPLHFEVDRLLVVATGASAGVWRWSGERRNAGVALTILTDIGARLRRVERRRVPDLS